MKPPRILIVTEVFYPEEFLINDIALSWKEQGFEVSVLTLAPSYPFGKVFAGYKNKLFSKDTYCGINVYRVRTVTGYRDSKKKKLLRYISFMFLGGIVASFIGRKFDHVVGYNLGSLTDMIPAVLIRKLHKKPLMFWVQDLWPDSVYAYGFKKTKILSYCLNSFTRFVYQSADCIAISSKGFEQKLQPYVKNLSMVYAPNWSIVLNPSADTIKLSEPVKVNFTFAGNIGKVQNLENIINAFSALNKEYLERAQLNIVGDGSNLENIKRISNGSSNIIFHGRHNSEDMSKFYKASDFLIISLMDDPVFSATVPGKMQTYIAAKKPILSVINGEVASIVVDNNLGINVSPSNVELIKKALERCIDMSEEERRAFTINNDRLLKTVFNKREIINNMTNQLLSCNC